MNTIFKYFSIKEELLWMILNDPLTGSDDS